MFIRRAQQKSQVRGVGEGHGTTHYRSQCVYADNEALRNPQYAITNTSGQAELKLPSKGICYYKVTYIGYVPVTGKIGGTQDEKVIYMKEDNLGINEVVVTGSRTARPIKMSPVTTQVLGGKRW